MAITTRRGAVYSLEYRDLTGSGTRLAILRRGAADDAPETNTSMVQNTWYRVGVLTPLPPEIGSEVFMILDPANGDQAPIVRFTSTVISTVGLL